ncbi:hypothetical protein [Nocardia tengchongensis]|uniref:hypothetical protein n=1 Tax=Nocardia tengchongensis TaxID=2055889 RepID=UPI0036AC80D7
MATDAELGFSTPHRVADEAGVNRKQFLSSALVVTTNAVLSNSAPTESELIDTMAGPTANYRRMESSAPSDRLAPVVDAHLNLVAGIVRDRLRTSGGFRALSEIAGLAAWLAADRGDDAAARRRRYVEWWRRPAPARCRSRCCGRRGPGDPERDSTATTARLDLECCSGIRIPDGLPSGPCPRPRRVLYTPRRGRGLHPRVRRTVAGRWALSPGIPAGHVAVALGRSPAGAA